MWIDVTDDESISMTDARKRLESKYLDYSLEESYGPGIVSGTDEDPFGVVK